VAFFVQPLMPVEQLGLEGKRILEFPQPLCSVVI
jgi:hypothetical protein